MIKESYRYYSLFKSLIANEKEIGRVIISSHYQINHPYLTDKIILELVK